MPIMSDSSSSSIQRRLQIERLRLRAQLERQQAIGSVQRVRRGLTARGLWHSVAGSGSPSFSAASLIMPAVYMWRRYPYLLGSAGSLVGACFRGRARLIWPLGILGVLAWRAATSRSAEKSGPQHDLLSPSD